MNSQHEIPNYIKVYSERKKNKYCLTIPVINEGKNIKNLLERISEIHLAKIVDIIIIDGGSTDNSLEVKNLKSKSIRTFLIMKDKGQLSSQLRCAYSFALKENYEGIITIDGNNKDNPEYVIEFIKKLEQGYDFVQASRFILNGKGINTPKLRYCAIRYVHAPLLSFFSNFKWTDTTQGFRAYSNKIFKDESVAPFRKIFTNYELLCYLSYRIPKLGYKCIEIPTVRTYPVKGTVTKINSISQYMRIIKILILSCLGFYNPS